MDSRLWHERLRGDLRRQGLPLSYIDRLVEELADHLVDSQTENPSMEAHQAYAQLGTTEQLAAAASHEFDRRSFAGRHPILTFVVSPILFAPLLFAGCLLSAIGIGWAIGSLPDLVGEDALYELPDATKLRIGNCILACFDFYVRFIPFALAAWLYCRLGRRIFLSPCQTQAPRAAWSMRVQIWPLIACSNIALIALFVFTKSTPHTPTSPGLYIIGLTTHPTLYQLLQLLPPFAIAGWFFFRPPQPSFPVSAITPG